MNGFYPFAVQGQKAEVYWKYFLGIKSEWVAGKEVPWKSTAAMYFPISDKKQLPNLVSN